MNQWEINPYGYTQDTFEYKMKITENEIYYPICDQNSNNLPLHFNISTYNVWGIKCLNFLFLKCDYLTLLK